MNKQQVLKLNRLYYPINISPWHKAITDIFSGAAYPVDVSYEQTEDGKINTSAIDSLTVVKTWEEWEILPIRPYDEYVHTVKKIVRMPTVVICSRYEQIPYKRSVFPTKENILKRDNYTCQYTGEKLPRDKVNIDHIMPVSRGGQNTWENMVCCSIEVNTRKADRTPREAGLKLIRPPVKPTNGNVFDFLRDEWASFVFSGKSNFGE